jgi:hypothetical protein
MSNLIKIVVFVPLTHADILRDVMSKAGAGVIGNYSNCTFSTRGVGRYKPIEGANPTIGEVGKLDAVEEERIETVCKKEKIKEVIQAIKKAHPYEEVALDIYPLLAEEDL